MARKAAGREGEHQHVAVAVDTGGEVAFGACLVGRQIVKIVAAAEGLDRVGRAVA